MKKTVIFAFAAALFMTACQSNENKHAEGESSGKIAYSAETFASDTDPICKMSVKEGAADTALVNGKAYGFCSSGCKDEFKKDPSKYIQ